MAMIFPVIFFYSMEIFPDKRSVASSLNIGMRYVVFAFLVYIATSSYNESASAIGIITLVASSIVFLMNRYLMRVKIFDTQKVD